MRVVLARYVAWLFPSRVNLHATLRGNFGFHGKFWQSTREWLRGATRGTSRVCEVVVERYRINTTHTHTSTYTNFLDKSNFKKPGTRQPPDLKMKTNVDIY